MIPKLHGGDKNQNRVHFKTVNKLVPLDQLELIEIQ